MKGTQFQIKESREVEQEEAKAKAESIFSTSKC
jgi:hypothetical protein